MKNQKYNPNNYTVDCRFGEYGKNLKYGTYKKYTPAKRYMSKMEFQILWTAIWLCFIVSLCLIFKNPLALFLLAMWFIGMF